MEFYIYDLETFVNCFLFAGKVRGSNEVQVFEISEFKNQRNELLSWLSYIKGSGFYNVGYNNVGFDYPILHEFLMQPYTFGYLQGYQAAQKIIQSNEYGRTHIPFKDRLLPQIDLAKINHFDNKHRRTSLKALQFAMRSQSVEDLPFDPHTPLTRDQIDLLIKYNIHDVTETERFLEKNMTQITMRKELLDAGILTGDVLNFSDVKLGEQYLIKKIGRNKCFQGSKPRQTFRSEVKFKDIILPKIQYQNESFSQVLEWFKSQTFLVKGEERPKFDIKLAGLEFFFGVGGLHASVESKRFESNETHVIKDIDVSGMYPAISTVNSFAPEHLGQDFLIAYKQLQVDRKQYKKGTTMNKTLKLANNGAFGKGDDPFSCFYDPKFPKSITVNGQLQLLQCAEILSMIPGLQLIQANTDGVTVYLPREHLWLFEFWCKEWEKETGLVLEHAEYSKMFIRDVNNYLAITTDGKVKRKGAYWFPESDEDYEGNWNKDFSMLIVQKAISKLMTDGWNPEFFIKASSDSFDFMKRYKVTAGSDVYIGDVKTSKTVRYYVSKEGQPMKKIARPKGDIGAYKRKNGISDSFYARVKSEVGEKWDERIHTKNKSRYEMVETSIESGWKVKECNDASKFNWNDVDYDYYLEEINKLII